MSIRVFNADDHPILRKGISDLLTNTQWIQWVGSASTGIEAIEKLRSLKPDVAILDIEMPGNSGIEVAQILLEEGINTSFILFTLHKEASFFDLAMKSGIRGYLLKESSESEILECIKSVAEGKPYVNSELTHLLFKKTEETVSPLSALSSQEINVLKLIARRMTSEEIATMLFISPKTVSNHRTNISRKLGLSGKQNGLLIWVMEHRSLFDEQW
jgi:DNA-binding NarL/FixJ family response regulator